MYEINKAAYAHKVDRAYRRPLLERMVDAISPGETKRIWGPQTFCKKDN